MRIRLESRGDHLDFGEVWKRRMAEGFFGDGRRRIEAHNRFRATGAGAAAAPEGKYALKVSAEIFARAEAIQGLGSKQADAVHLAAAEFQSADAFLSCDDRLCRRAKRQRSQ